MNIFENISLEKHIVPAAIILLSFFVGLVFKKLIVRRISKIAKESRTRLDDVLVKSLRSVVVVWVVLLGIFLIINISPFSDQERAFLDKLFQALLIFSIFWFLMRLLGELFLAYSDKFQKRAAEASIIQNAVKVFVLLIGVLIILQVLGISITPLITTLGIGGLAIALALQDTLANLFAGFHIIGTQRVKPGDYIKLGSGEEGYVVDVTWRDTVLRQLPNNYVIIPNKELSSDILVNYYRPKRAMNVLVEVGVDYASDLEKVEQVTLEIARQTLEQVPGGAKKFEPFMRFHTFGDSSIDFTVHLRCEEFYDKFLVQHEFIKRLKRRYDKEGINIPFPIRTIHYRDKK